MIRRLILLATVLGAALLLATACGGDDDAGKTGSASAASGTSGPTQKAASGDANADAPSVSGQIQLSGKLSGTFTWNKDLAINWCGTSRVGFTMSDGKDTFISIESATLNDGTDKSTLGSAKLGGTYTGKSAKIEAKQTASLGSAGTVTWSNTEFKNAAGETVTANGKLTFNC